MNKPISNERTGSYAASVELPFIEQDQSGEVTPAYLEKRLRIILGLVRRLTKEGWTFKSNLNGLICQPPADVVNDANHDDEDEDLSEFIMQHLKKLEIDEYFRAFLCRRIGELDEAEQAMEDRVWYERKLVCMNAPGWMEMNKAFIPGMLQAMQDVEKKYGGTLEIKDDFQ